MEKHPKILRKTRNNRKKTLKSWNWKKKISPLKHSSKNTTEPWTKTLKFFKKLQKNKNKKHKSHKDSKMTLKLWVILVLLWFYFLSFCFLLFVFVSLCIFVCPEATSVDHAGLKLKNPPTSASLLLGFKAWTTTAWQP